VARMGPGEVHIGFWWGSLSEICHLKDMSVDGAIIEVRWECIGWINLAQDRNRWQACVNAIINFGVPV